MATNPIVENQQKMENAALDRMGLTPFEIFQQVCERHGIGPEVPGQQVFLRGYRAFSGRGSLSAEAEDMIFLAFRRFEENKHMPGYQLPDYVYRWRDPDTIGTRI